MIGGGGGAGALFARPIICMYKYSVDIYLLCMIKVGLGGVLVVSEECYNLV